jgi:predicted dehydrogenase
VSHGPRIAVVGAGAHAGNAIQPALQRLAADVVAISDRDEDRARGRARSFGIPQCYTDHRDLLDAERPDAVVAVGPPAMHVEVGVDALSAGAHIFVEKPPAADLAGAVRLRDAATAAGRFVMVGFTKRFAKPYRRAKAIAATAEFGAPHLLRLNISHWRVPSLREHMLLNGVHAFDLARFFLGDVVGGTIAKREIAGSHAVALLLEHAEGGLSQITTSALEPRYQESLELAGDNALIQVHGLYELRYLRPAPDKHQAAEHDDETMAGLWYPQASLPYLEHQSLNVQGYVPELREFLACVTEGRWPSPGIDDGVAAMALVEAVADASLGRSELALPKSSGQPDDRNS